jgi:hypothetical protein
MSPHWTQRYTTRYQYQETGLRFKPFNFEKFHQISQGGGWKAFEQQAKEQDINMYIHVAVILLE